MRKVRTSSGATAVQIVCKSGGVRRIVEHLGSAHSKTELAALLEVGRQRIAAWQGQGMLDLESVSVWILFRSLGRCGQRGYREAICQALFDHVTASGGLALCLYDVTTLYFEAEREDDLRKVGYSKERRGDPQIIVGLLGACLVFCVSVLQVGVDSVGVGGGELGQGLVPVGGDLSFDELALGPALGCWQSFLLVAFSGSFVHGCRRSPAFGSFITASSEGKWPRFIGDPCAAGSSQSRYCWWRGYLPRSGGEMTRLSIGGKSRKGVNRSQARSQVVTVWGVPLCGVSSGGG